MQEQKQHEGRPDRGGRNLALLGSIVLAAMTFMIPAQAALTFVFTYTDPAGVGFNHAVDGPARKTALNQTATLLANMFPTLTGTINMSVNGAETNNAVLAAAGSNFNGPAATCTVGFNRGDVGIIALGGTDPAPGTADGTVTVNFQDIMWDLDDAVSAGLFDFKSTMLHELMHAMGFSHSVTQAGADACGTAAPTAGSWVFYDQHLGDNTAKFLNGAFVINTAAWTTAANGGTGPTAGTLWRGANGMAGNGGLPVPLFSPAAFTNGSSISHLDDNFFVTLALLMEAATGPGPGTRTLSTQEVGIMKDIGFAGVVVPVELQSFTID